MIINPIKVKEDINLRDAMKSIIKNKVSGICVVDDNDVLLGVLSEMDCLAAILKATYNEIGVGLVSEYMIKEVVVANPHDDIIDIAQDMLLKKHRRRPVTKDGILIGLVSCRQLLTAVDKFSA
jgi:CBS domain-containing protein